MSEKESAATLARIPKSLADQITGAKIALDMARRMNDPLRIDLAESTLNNLLEQAYSSHSYHP